MRALRPFLFCVLPILILQQASLSQASPDNRIRCEISVPNTNWASDGDTLIRVTLTNRTKRIVNLKFHSTLYLTPTDDPDPMFRSLWAPVDLAKDAPGPVSRSGMNDSSIRQIPQRLRLTPSSSTTFALHASQMNWQRRISSVWPNRRLTEVAPPGEYNLQLELEGDSGNVQSNSVALTISKEPRPK